MLDSPKVRAPTEAEQLEKKEYKKTLEDLRAKLLLIHPFTANLALYLELTPTVDTRLKTAATDGSHIFFQIEFLKKLSAEMIIFVLAHEVWHCVAGHLVRKLNRDPKLWNYAADHEVNALLQRDGFNVPSDAVFIPAWDELSAEKVYQYLLDDGTEIIKECFQFDQHTIEDNKHDHEATESIVDPSFLPNQTDIKDIQHDWEIRTIFVADNLQKIGMLPGRFNLFINKMLKSQLNWKMVLRQFVQRSDTGNQKTWTPPSRRHFWRGLYLPSSRATKINLVVAIDTSGSTRSFLNRFISELSALMKEFSQIQLCLIECDSNITQVRNFSESYQLDQALKLGFTGGGGTEFNPVFDYVKQHNLQPDCLVFFTDGYGMAPQLAPHYPVLWLLVGGDQQPSSWGSTVVMDTQ